MNKESCDNHIATLKKVRDEYRSQLDDRVLSNLEQLIAELEEVRSRVVSAEDGFRIAVKILGAVGVVIKLVTNIQDWMK